VAGEGAAFRLVPEELKPYMDSDPTVVALVFAYKRGDMDEASMWKALPLHQTQAGGPTTATCWTATRCWH